MGVMEILIHWGYIIDSIKIGKMLEEELEVAKADRMKNWNITPTMQLNSDCCELAIVRKINKDNPTMSDDDKKELRLKRLRPIWDLQSEIFQFR